MKQKEKKEKFQVGDVVLVRSGNRIATVTDIDPWHVHVKYDDDGESVILSYAVPHYRIIPTIDRRPTLRQKIGLWWYDLSKDNKTYVVITAINAVLFVINVAIIVLWLTISITR